MKIIKKTLSSTYLLIFLLVTYSILCPLEIYVGNKDELLFSISDFFPILIGIAAVGIIVGTHIFSILPEKIYKPLYVLTFAFALMSYIQNMFLNSTLMRDDGGKMEWDKLQGKIVVNTVVWVAVFTIVIALSFTLLKKNYIKVYSYIFSQGSKDDYKKYERYGNIYYYIDMSPMKSFLHMVRADILVTSKSSFSYKPALLSDGIRICPEGFLAWVPG